MVTLCLRWERGPDYKLHQLENFQGALISYRLNRCLCSFIEYNVYNFLFLDVLNEHAPIRRIKIKAKPNPFVTPEIKQLMKTRDNWHKSAMKTNDKLLKLHWNAYKFFKQEVKREIRLAERIYVKSQIVNSKGNKLHMEGD